MDEFDALLLPGGVANPDRPRTQPKAVQFVQRFVASDKPIGDGPHRARAARPEKRSEMLR